MLRRQPSAQSTPLPVSPFRFDPQLADQPSHIELHFVYAEQRYEFELALTQERIVEERLVAFPKGKETLLYERHHQAMGDEYIFGQQLEGGKDLHELWKKSTGPQVLFLAQAVANSSEDFKQLRAPLMWLQGGFMVFSADMEALTRISQEKAETDESFAEALSSFLQEVDVPVTNIRFEKIQPNLEKPNSTELLQCNDYKTEK